MKEFADFLQSDLQQQPIIGSLERMYSEGSSPAGKSREGIFTYEFLRSAIKRFFYEHKREELKLSSPEIRNGLSIEGYSRVREDFGFGPAAKTNHLFTKDHVIKANPPQAWFKENAEKLTGYKASPDFAVGLPLPFSIVGEVKYFRSGSPNHAVKVLYEASRQAVFYLGAFKGAYKSAMVVVADASRGHTFFEGLRLIRPELLGRFGADTDIYVVPIRLS